MNRLFFSSVLKSEYWDDLEALIFFNPQQGRVKTGIIECIQKYGKPKIAVEGELLRIQVEGFSNVQSLFAFDKVDSEEADCLVGLMVYVRSDIENIVVLHLAVVEEYSASGSHASEMLVMRLFVRLREISRRLKGLHAVRLAYENDEPLSRAIPLVNGGSCRRRGATGG